MLEVLWKEMLELCQYLRIINQLRTLEENLFVFIIDQKHAVLISDCVKDFIDL